MKLESLLLGSVAAEVTNSTKFAVALVLFLGAIMAVAAGGYKYNSPADTAALPFSGKAANETPVRATKGDRSTSVMKSAESPV